MSMPYYEVSVDNSFAAYHSLPLPCGETEPRHEHHWHITAVFAAEQLDDVMGVVIDFLAVDKAMKAICSDLEGGDLNTLPAFADGKASAERVAAFLAGELAAALADELGTPGEPGPWLARVRVTEAPGCAATFIADRPA